MELTEWSCVEMEVAQDGEMALGVSAISTISTLHLFHIEFFHISLIVDRQILII